MRNGSEAEGDGDEGVQIEAGPRLAPTFEFAPVVWLPAYALSDANVFDGIEVMHGTDGLSSFSRLRWEAWGRPSCPRGLPGCGT